jgi:hypothetical protein
MHTRPRSLLTFSLRLLFLSLASGGCSTSPASEKAPDGGGVIPDAAATLDASDGGEAGGPSTLSVVVYERSWPEFAALTTTPLLGVSVIADLPDGTRQEATTDANGTVSFPDVDWSNGTATVTAYRSGSPLVSRLGITRDQASQRLWVRAIPPRLILVSGTMINFDTTSQYVVIESPQSGGRYQNVISPSSNNFQFEAPSNIPFTLIAATFESLPDNGDAGPVNGREENSTYTGWVRQDIPASNQGVPNVVLDFAKGLVPSTTYGTMELSSQKSSPLYTDAEPYFQVSHIGNIGFFGAPSRTILSADGFSCSYRGPYVNVAGLEQVSTEYQLQLGSGFSFVRFAGYPVDGADVGGFIEEPQIIEPSDPTVPGKITDPIVWSVRDPEARATLLLDRSGGIGIVWELTSLSSAPILTVPQPPAEVDVATIFGTAPLNGFLQLGVDCDPPEDPWYWSCSRGSMQTQPLFLISPP